jgi:subtilase family serine protease
MKIKRLFGLFTVVAFLVTSLGAVPVAAISTVSTMLEKGPQAVLSSVTTSANTDYGLFTCQVGLRPFSCYDPYQMRTAYGTDKLIAAGYDGFGKTIVIIDAYQSPYIVDQLNYFNSYYGLASLNGLGGPYDASLGTFTQVAPDGLTPFNKKDGNMIGWAEEISLDVEWAHAIAPGANITLVLAKSNEDADILSATKYAVDNNLGDVISQSFGEDESCMDPNLLAQQHQVFVDATLKNITLFASSGDDGAAQPTCDGSSVSKAVSSPASDPLVTAVGGTELQAAGYCLAALGCDPSANPAPGTYQGEVAWNESALGIGASGGGFSVLFDSPSYQSAAVNSSQLGVPDVSYNAAVYTGVLTYLDIPGFKPQDVGFYLFGGTSAGSPQWAAILAIADQAAGRDLGFINSGLYQIGQATGKYATSFYDVTSGNNSVVEGVAVQGFDAGPGWDAVTGLGSPVSDQLAYYLNSYVSSGDATSVIANTTPHSNSNPSGPGYFISH